MTELFALTALFIAYAGFWAYLVWRPHPPARRGLSGGEIAGAGVLRECERLRRACGEGERR